MFLFLISIKKQKKHSNNQYVTQTEKQESKAGTTYNCYTLKTQWNNLYLPYITWYVTSTQYPTHWRRSETIYIHHTLSGTSPLLNILHIKDSVKQSIFTIHCIVHHLYLISYILKTVKQIYNNHTLHGTWPLLNILHIDDSMKQSIFTIHCVVPDLYLISYVLKTQWNNLYLLYIVSYLTST